MHTLYRNEGVLFLGTPAALATSQSDGSRGHLQLEFSSPLATCKGNQNGAENPEESYGESSRKHSSHSVNKLVQRGEKGERNPPDCHYTVTVHQADLRAAGRLLK